VSIFLARRGAEVTLFDAGGRPELLVGESLVPAAVPILQRLGIEERWPRDRVRAHLKGISVKTYERDQVAALEVAVGHG